jgi:hypothetical protein
MKTVTQHYRGLSAEMKAYLTLANKEVGLGATLEFIAHLAGLPCELKKGEREALSSLAIARGIQIKF